jgi:DNA-directed RNA polymerase specialized sigma24 family protein
MKQRRNARIIDDMVREIHARLMRTDDQSIVDDPIGCLTRAALEVERRQHKAHLRVVSQDQPADAAGQNTSGSPAIERSIQAAVNTLPRLQRALLVQHINDGLTYRQIAQRMLLPEQTVLVELARAYSQLRQDLTSFDLSILPDRHAH